METHELIDKTVGKATGWTMPFDDQYPADSRKRAQVTREKTRLLYSSAPIEITVALLFTITIVFILWGKAGNSVLLPWAGINLLLLVARSVLVFRYIRIRNISLFNASRCFNFFLAGLFASGVAFGSAAFVLFPIDFLHDALTGLILGGLAVGAVGFYSVSLHVFFLYCLPVLLPMVSMFMFTETDIHMVFGAGGVALLVLLGLSVYKMSRNISDSIFLISDNQDLIKELSHEVEVRLHAERKALENEERFRRTFDDAPIGAAMVAMDGTIEEANSRLYQYLGYGARELAGMEFVQLIDAEERMASSVDISKVHSGEMESYDVDRNFIKKDGSTFWGHLSIRMVRDSLGEPLYFLPMIEDINDKKLMEQEILKGKKIWEETFNSIPDSIAILDNDSNILMANAATSELFDIKDMEGKKCFEAFHGESRVPQLCPQAKMVEGGSATIEEFHENYSGRHIEVRLVPRHNEKWELDGFIHIARDITERRKAEEELKKLSRAVEQSPVSVVITDTKGIIEYVNPNFTEVTGYSFQEAVGSTTSILKSGEQPDEFYKDMWEMISAGNVWRGEFRNKKKNGELYWENAVIAPIKGNEGDVTHFIAVKEDITEKKMAQDALMAAKEAAEHANSAKSNFLSRMSHEIRTPMNAITGMSSLLQMTDLSSQQMNYTNNIHNASHALLQIINDILDFSKIEAGQLRFESIEFELEEVMNDIRSIIALEARYKGLELSFDISDEIPGILVGDPLRLKQVLINLAGNAVKFTEKGEVSIIAEMASMEKDTVTIRLSVTDSGIGINKKQISELFKPFAQADGSTTREYGGTGLGLSICKRLVEMMGGEISVESASGKGAKFSFSAAFGLSENNTGRRQPGREATVIYSDVKKKRSLEKVRGSRVLLVEDNAINQLLAVELLENAGMIVDVAANGQEAVEAVNGIGYDLVLMDIEMPVMDGYGSTRKIRKNASSKDLPIIAMTAHAMEEHKHRSLESGMNDHISKPIDIKELHDKLLKWISPRDVPPHKGSAETREPEGMPIGEIPGFDVHAGFKRFDYDRELYLEVLVLFRSLHFDAAEKLRAFLNEGESREARLLTHTIKGSASNVGAIDLARASGEIEAVLEQNADKIPEELVVKFENALSTAISGLDSLAHLPEESAGMDAQYNALGELIPYLETRRPKKCNKIMDEISDLYWPDNIKPFIKELEKHISKYQYDVVLEKIGPVMERLRN